MALSTIEPYDAMQAFKKYNEKSVAELIDPQLEEVVDNGLLMKMVGVAIQCAAPMRSDRPNMKLVGEQLWVIGMDYLKSRNSSSS